MRLRTWVGLLTVAVAGTVAAACGGGDDDVDMDMDMGDGMVAPVAGADLTVNLTNWAISPTTRELQSGTIKVAAVHPRDHGGHESEGGVIHQLVIGKLKPGAKHGQSQFEGLELNLTDIKVGETKTGEVELEPGEYELACLLVEKDGDKTYDHYKEGMHTSITVK
jgi:hypothetical protein